VYLIHQFILKKDKLLIVNFYKILIISFFFLLFGQNSFGQFDASIWCGLNNASFGGNPPEDAKYESIYGLCFGADLNYQLTEDVIISFEPSFNQTGSDIVFGNEDRILDTVKTFTIKQNYFGLGLIFKIDTKRFYVGAGLSFQLLTSANLEYESAENDIKDRFLNYDVVSFFNVGYKIPVGTPNLFIELRYIQGLLNINSDESELNSEIYIANFKSSGLKLSVGITFPI
jgi:hypothetical protein